MQPDQPQDPEYYPKPSYRGVAWLNGITWVIIVGCFLLAAISQGYVLLFALVLVAGASALANFSRGLWLYATDRGKQAKLYFIAFLPLALLDAWLWNGFNHLGKIGG